MKFAKTLAVSAAMFAGMMSSTTVQAGPVIVIEGGYSPEQCFNLNVRKFSAYRSYLQAVADSDATAAMYTYEYYLQLSNEYNTYC